MFDQILTLAMSYVQIITAVLIFIAVILEIVHIGQTRRMNKRLARAGHWLQRYLETVFRDDACEEVEKAEAESVKADDGDYETEECSTEENVTEEAVQLSAGQPLRSRQEENMRVTLKHKKQKKDEELLDTVLQEIFD